MQDTHWESLTPLQRCSHCILQPQPTRQSVFWIILPLISPQKWWIVWIENNNWCMSVGWKVHRLTKILLWNVSKWGLFSNIVSLTVHSLLLSVLLYLDSISKKMSSSADMMTLYELFSLSSYFSRVMVSCSSDD